jgi:hypothetical protein
MGYTKSELTVLPIAFSVMLAITLFLRLGLKGRSEKLKRAPFFVITVTMVAGEVVKQLRGLFVGYDLWWIPLHFCSTYFIWFSLAEFTRGEFSKRMKNVAFLASAVLFFAFYSQPRAIISSACEDIFRDFSTAHSFFFHHLALLYFMLSVGLEQVKVGVKDIPYWTVGMGVYYLLAVGCAFALNVNYFSVLENPVPLFDAVRVRCSQLVYNLLQGSVLVFGVPLVVLIVERLKRLRG